MRLFPYSFRCFCVIDVLMTCDIFCLILISFEWRNIKWETSVVLFVPNLWIYIIRTFLRPISKMSKLGWLNFPWNFLSSEKKKFSTFHLTFCIFGALRFWYKCKFSWTKWFKRKFWSFPIPFSCNGQYPRGGFYFCMKLPFVVTLPKLLLDNQSLMLVVLPLRYLERKIFVRVGPIRAQ